MPCALSPQERPERQIYVPRRALEKQRQGSPQLTETPKEKAETPKEKVETTKEKAEPPKEKAGSASWTFDFKLCNLNIVWLLREFQTYWLPMLLTKQGHQRIWLLATLLIYINCLEGSHILIHNIFHLKLIL